MLFIFLLVVHAIIATALVAVILMQRSEGGGLGMGGGGGSPSGLMNARGAADFLTRATTVLATIFVMMSIGLAVLAASQRGTREIDTSLARPAGAAGAPAEPAPPAVPPAEGDAPATAPATTPAPAAATPAAPPAAAPVSGAPAPGE